MAEPVLALDLGSTSLRALVVVQMTLAVMLLIGSGLLIKSFVRLRAVDPGFEVDQRIGFRVQVMQERRQVRAIPAILRRLEAERDEFVRQASLTALHMLESH